MKDCQHMTIHLEHPKFVYYLPRLLALRRLPKGSVCVPFSCSFPSVLSRICVDFRVDCSNGVLMGVYIEQRMIYGWLSNS